MLVPLQDGIKAHSAVLLIKNENIEIGFNFLAWLSLKSAFILNIVTEMPWLFDNFFENFFKHLYDFLGT